jgi:hypothetical protein
MEAPVTIFQGVTAAATYTVTSRQFASKPRYRPWSLYVYASSGSPTFSVQFAASPDNTTPPVNFVNLGTAAISGTGVYSFDVNANYIRATVSSVSGGGISAVVL